MNIIYIELLLCVVIFINFTVHCCRSCCNARNSRLGSRKIKEENGEIGDGKRGTGKQLGIFEQV